MTQKLLKTVPGTPQGSMVSLRSSTYPFFIDFGSLLGVPGWSHFCSFLSNIFKYFLEPLFNTDLGEYGWHFDSFLQAFLVHFQDPLKKWKFDSCLGGSTVFKGLGGPEMQLFWVISECRFWVTFLWISGPFLGPFRVLGALYFHVHFHTLFQERFFSTFLSILGPKREGSFV